MMVTRGQVWVVGRNIALSPLPLRQGVASTSHSRKLYGLPEAVGTAEVVAAGLVAPGSDYA